MNIIPWALIPVAFFLGWWVRYEAELLRRANNLHRFHPEELKKELEKHKN